MSAAVWANIIACFSAAGAISGAVFAGIQAAKSRSSARDAQEALSAILRPEFVPDVPDALGDEISVAFANVARHDALDVRAEIRAEDGQKLGEGSIHREVGRVPNTWGDEPTFHVRARGLAALNELGASYQLIMVLWFTDERRMKKWRQELRVTRTVTEEHGRTYVRSQNHLELPTAS